MRFIALQFNYLYKSNHIVHIILLNELLRSHYFLFIFIFFPQ